MSRCFITIISQATLRDRPQDGTLADYLALGKRAAPPRDEVLHDMENPVCTEDHIWWKDGINNPASKYSDYIIYDDKEHTKPTQHSIWRKRAVGL